MPSLASLEKTVPDLVQALIVELRLWQHLSLIVATSIDKLVVLKKANVDAVMLELLGSVSAEMIANFLPEGPLATPEHLHVAAWNKASDKLFGHILLVVRKAVEGMGIKSGLEMIMKVQQNVL